MIAGKRPFTPPVLDDLRERFFQSARTEKAVEKVSVGMDSALNAVMSTLEAAGRDAKAYGQTLSAATGELSTAASPDGVRKMVDGLVSATRAMETRAKTLEGELQRSSQQVSELRVQLEDVRRESLTDPLTGIANRKAFDATIAAAARQAAETGEPLALLMCDIDRFKKFNDTWGHQTGDQVIRLVAGCLAENVKGRDNRRPLRRRRVRRGPAADRARRCRAPGAAHPHHGGRAQAGEEVERRGARHHHHLIGAAQFGPGDDIAALVRRADDCLYAAKNAGRNCVIAEKRSAGPIADCRSVVLNSLHRHGRPCGGHP